MSIILQEMRLMPHFHDALVSYFMGTSDTAETSFLSQYIEAVNAWWSLDPDHACEPLRAIFLEETDEKGSVPCVEVIVIEEVEQGPNEPGDMLFRFLVRSWSAGSKPAYAIQKAKVMHQAVVECLGNLQGGRTLGAAPGVVEARVTRGAFVPLQAALGGWTRVLEQEVQIIGVEHARSHSRAGS